ARLWPCRSGRWPCGRRRWAGIGGGRSWTADDRACRRPATPVVSATGSSPVRTDEVAVPLFLDRHDIPGATAVDLAMAHARDVEIEKQYGVKYITYWFDPSRGTAFCLAEGP